MSDIAVMTVRIRKATAEKLVTLLKDIGIKRDIYLSQLLENEIEALRSHEPNSERAEQFVKFQESSSGADKIRLGIKLDKSLIEKMNDVCRMKRVSRDLFIETFFDYLANGYQDKTGDAFNTYPSPLDKVAAILNDPYWEVNGSLDLYKTRCFVSDETLSLLEGLNKSFGTSG